MAKKAKNPKSRTGIWSALFGLIRSQEPLGIFIQEEERLVRTSSGIEVYQSDEFCWKIRWNEVSGVYAYKLDALSVDVICFAFQKRSRNDIVWCIHEDMPGFKEVVEDIERLTKGGWPARFRDVAVPAFEFNWTELWRAPDSLPLSENPIHLIWKPIPDDLRRELQLDTDE